MITPLRKVESFIQMDADNFSYLLECGHSVTLFANADNPSYWMLRCEKCAIPNLPKHHFWQ